MPLLKDLISIPERVHQGDFVLKLADGVTHAEATLRDWLRDPVAMKPNYSDPANLDSTGGLSRGMPNLNLTEDQIDQLIAYLLERN